MFVAMLRLRALGHSHSWLMFVFAVMVAVMGCTNQPAVTLAPRDPTPSRPAPTLSTESVAVERCGDAVASATVIEAIAEPPAPPAVPGARGTDEEELNAGERPEVPADPDADTVTGADVPPTSITPPGAQDEPSVDDLILFGLPADLNTGWELNTTEPEVAASGSDVLVTWNKMAALSTDGGATFDYLFRESTGPAPVPPFEEQPPFCCDQRAQHDPTHDLWLWLLQYEALSGTSNQIRLTVADGNDFAAKRFTSYWDFTPQMAGYADGVWFDQPKIGTSAGHVFLSINAFEGNDFKSAVVFRVSLADLAARQPAAPTCFKTDDLHDRDGFTYFGLYPVRTAGDTMYLAGQYDWSTLAIWRWPDAAEDPSFHLARSSRSYTRATHTAADGRLAYDPYACPRTGSDAQRGGDWCFRPVRGETDRSGNDDRITSGWLSGNELGFAWNVPQDTSSDIAFPYVWITLLDVTKLNVCGSGECVLGHPSIRFEDTAVQYAAITPNAHGELGAVALMGGGEYRFSCVAFARSDSTSVGSWDPLLVRASTRDHAGSTTSGDYLGIWADGGRDTAWAGSCMTVQSGLTEPNVVHFARFGRRVDQP